MDTTTIDPLLEQPDLNVTRGEMHQLGDAALDETDLVRRAYLTGAFIGYGIALGIGDSEALEHARQRVPFGACVDIDHIPGLSQMPDDAAATAHACGLRWGFKEATRFGDVDECGDCGERLMPDDEKVSCPIAGASFCDWDLCHDEWHGAVSGRRSCYALDER